MIADKTVNSLEAEAIHIFREVAAEEIVHFFRANSAEQ